MLGLAFGKDGLAHVRSKVAIAPSPALDFTAAVGRVVARRLGS